MKATGGGGGVSKPFNVLWTKKVIMLWSDQDLKPGQNFMDANASKYAMLIAYHASLSSYAYCNSSSVCVN